MTKIRLKYVNEYRDRHGRVRRYFRRPGCRAIPLPGLPGSIEFMTAYEAALAIVSPPPPSPKHVVAGSLADVAADTSARPTSQISHPRRRGPTARR